jgi:hypothetical protein
MRPNLITGTRKIWASLIKFKSGTLDRLPRSRCISARRDACARFFSSRASNCAWRKARPVFEPPNEIDMARGHAHVEYAVARTVTLTQYSEGDFL